MKNRLMLIGILALIGVGIAALAITINTQTPVILPLLQKDSTIIIEETNQTRELTLTKEEKAKATEISLNDLKVQEILKDREYKIHKINDMVIIDSTKKDRDKRVTVSIGIESDQEQKVKKLEELMVIVNLDKGVVEQIIEE
ncbi:MAG TPA: hypothetical protein C5S37_05545 [Methanophagales archaeon]|nr:hypothetical protein [Methanophagales archaeon]